MTNDNFNTFELAIIDAFQKGNKTFESLMEFSTIPEATLNRTLESLMSRKIIIFNPITKEYEYETPIEGEMIVLEGNILLPVTILKFEKNGYMLVNRGKWYKFGLDFDIRRIIWNVKLDSKNNSTLVELIKATAFKERKTKNMHDPSWDNIRYKYVPFEKNMQLKIINVGVERTDVEVVFYIPLSTNQVTIEHTGFRVKTEISTVELVTELQKNVEDRDYAGKIHINKIYNLSDFLFVGNEIPISLKDGKLEYLKIAGNKKKYEFQYYEINNSGTKKRTNVEAIENMDNGIDILKNIFEGLPLQLLFEHNFNCELED